MADRLSKKDYWLWKETQQLLGNSVGDDAQVFSGADIQAAMYVPSLSRENVMGSDKAAQFKVFANLDTISISSTRSVSPVRTLGRKNPIAFTRGCIQGTELIHTARGLIPVCEIERGDLIFAQDEASGSLLLDRCTDKILTGTKPVFEVLLADGSCMRLTADHKVKTLSGWKPVSQLVRADMLIVPAAPVPVSDPMLLEDHTVELLAFCFASEIMGGKGDELDMDIPSARFHVVSRVVQVLEAHNLQYSVSAGGQMHVRCVDMGLGAFRSCFNMQHVGRLDNSQLALFLRCVWGVLGNAGKSSAMKAIEIPFMQREHARFLKTLLCRLGIHSRMVNSHLEITDLYRLVFCQTVRPDLINPKINKFLLELCSGLQYRAVDFHCFLRQHGIPCKEAFTFEVNGKTALGLIPQDRRIEFCLTCLPTIKQRDFRVEPLVSVTEAGLAETYDIEVEKHHNLFGAFLSHNSRTFAGTLIFTSINHDVFHDVYSTHYSENVSGPNDLFVDQMPPFSVLLLMANERGGMAMQSINGIHIVNFGTTYSINEILTQTQYTYVATEITPMLPLDDKKLGPHDKSLYEKSRMQTAWDLWEQKWGRVRYAADFWQDPTNGARFMERVKGLDGLMRKYGVPPIEPDRPI